LKLGFTPEFEKELIMKVVSNSFAALLFSLGVHMGRNVERGYEIPSWILKSKLWQKRLFLASLFGAEMSFSRVTGNNFSPPYLFVSRSKKFEKNGKIFILQITDLLSEFGIKTQKPGECESGMQFKIMVSDDIKNLSNFYETINFEYNRFKRNESNAIVQYLKIKDKVVREREEKAKIAKELYKNGKSPSEMGRK